MTKQEAIKILERDCPKRPQKLWSVKRTEAIHMAIEALKTRADGDTISRRDAISAIKKDIMGGLNYESILEELPPAQPEREILDELMTIMKEYYFTHRYEYDEAWENGFAKCMNLIPNVYEKRKR